ncbi:MAG TPA: class III lanthipeptide [Longimicrobiaceae bacterium]|jgi:hypothetical protein
MNRILALQKLETRSSARPELEFCDTTGGGSTVSAGCTGGTVGTSPSPSTSPDVSD